MSTDDVANTGMKADDPLRALFRIMPDPETTCPMLLTGARGTNVTRDEVCENGTCLSGCKCRVAVTASDGERWERQLVEGTISDGCVCPAFKQHDCVADIESFRDGELLVRVTVPNRRELQAIVDTARQRGARVELDQVLPLSNDGGRTKTIELDTETITELQRETAELAFDAGYYERPREADLSELADELGITESAVSQRLNSAESKLIHELTKGE